jgi:hypothetical protein
VTAELLFQLIKSAYRKCYLNRISSDTFKPKENAEKFQKQALRKVRENVYLLKDIKQLFLQSYIRKNGKECFLYVT